MDKFIMGKRSNFKRIEKDFYRTPLEAVGPLLAHLPAQTRFYEPCYGDGALIAHLCREDTEFTCVGESDLARDARTTDYQGANGADCFITNPPWSREILHPIIVNLKKQLPTWLLFDADWMHTKQSADLIRYCHAIISVGRVKWIPDSPHTGKDNCCWYLFRNTMRQTVFHGRSLGVF